MSQTFPIGGRTAAASGMTTYHWRRRGGRSRNTPMLYVNSDDLLGGVEIFLGLDRHVNAATVLDARLAALQIERHRRRREFLLMSRRDHELQVVGMIMTTMISGVPIWHHETYKNSPVVGMTSSSPRQKSFFHYAPNWYCLGARFVFLPPYAGRCSW